jgi:hypothetical protein
MNDTDFLAPAHAYQDGVLTPDELATLESAMRDDATKRQLFADTQLRSMALHDRFRQEAFQSGCGFSRTPNGIVSPGSPAPSPRWPPGLSSAFSARPLSGRSHHRKRLPSGCFRSQRLFR